MATQRLSDRVPAIRVPGGSRSRTRQHASAPAGRSHRPAVLGSVWRRRWVEGHCSFGLHAATFGAHVTLLHQQGNSRVRGRIPARTRRRDDSAAEAGDPLLAETRVSCLARGEPCLHIQTGVRPRRRRATACVPQAAGSGASVEPAPWQLGTESGSEKPRRSLTGADYSRQGPPGGADGRALRLRHEPVCGAWRAVAGRDRRRRYGGTDALDAVRQAHRSHAVVVGFTGR